MHRVCLLLNDGEDTTYMTEHMGEPYISVSPLSSFDLPKREIT